MKTGQACLGTTKKGEPCKKDAAGDTGYCRQHASQADEVRDGVTYDETLQPVQRAFRGFAGPLSDAARALRRHVSQRGSRPRRERSQIKGTRPLALHHQRKTPRGIDHQAKMVLQGYRTWVSPNNGR